MRPMKNVDGREPRPPWSSYPPAFTLSPVSPPSPLLSCAWPPPWRPPCPTWAGERPEGGKGGRRRLGGARPGAVGCPSLPKRWPHLQSRCLQLGGGVVRHCVGVCGARRGGASEAKARGRSRVRGRPEKKNTLSIGWTSLPDARQGGGGAPSSPHTGKRGHRAGVERDSRAGHASFGDVPRCPPSLLQPCCPTWPPRPR